MFVLVDKSEQQTSESSESYLQNIHLKTLIDPKWRGINAKN